MTAVPAPAPAPSPPPRKGRVFDRVSAVAAVLLFGAGAFLVAGWLRDRNAVQGGPEREYATAAPPADREVPAPPVDPRMEEWMDKAVNWGPLRAVSFGHHLSWFTAGPSHEHPAAVFGRALKRWQQQMTDEMRRRTIEAGPSAAVALRLQATTGSLPQCAFLVRMPLDAEAAKKRKLRTEPGGVALAFPARGDWEYVLFWFPAGMDFDDLAPEFKPEPGVLAVLGPEADLLDPRAVLRASPGAAGGATVLCRSRGPAGAAIDRLVSGLESRGWHGIVGSRREGLERAVALTGPRESVWIDTADRDADGGLVTVVLGNP